jgi:hypothetical protein
MADERVTERPQDSLPEKDSDRFADELTASQLNRTHEMPLSTPEEVAVPNIALDTATFESSDSISRVLL